MSYLSTKECHYCEVYKRRDEISIKINGLKAFEGQKLLLDKLPKAFEGQKLLLDKLLP